MIAPVLAARSPLVVALAAALALATAVGGCGGSEGGTADAGARDATAPDADAAPAEDPDAAAEPPLVRSTDFAEAGGEVTNADRGFYWWDWNDDASLVLVKVQLGAHCDAPALPGSLLDDIRDRLGAHRDAGRRAIVRFVYADDGVLNRCGRADAASIEVVEAHVAALAPIFAEFVDVIAFVEAGFFGMWGEWNSEHAPAGTALWESAENRRRVLRALLDAVPAERAIQVRRPRFRDELSAIFTPAELARIGFHDDCFLASATDYGTYEPPRTVEEWKDYVRGATSVVPWGGETCHDDSTYTVCPSALADLARLRADYLHEGYSPAVIDRWRTEGCLDEIRRRLGYRIVLRAVEAPLEIAPGGVLRVRLELENVGFAPPRSMRRFRILLRDAGDGSRAATLAPSAAPADTRGWLPGAIGPVEIAVDVPAELPAGSFEVRLAILDDASDAPAYALLFANDERVRDDARRENVLARIDVTPR